MGAAHPGDPPEPTNPARRTQPSEPPERAHRAETPERAHGAEPTDGAPPAEPEPFRPFAVAATERIYASSWCGLRRDTVVLPDGAHQDYHVFEVPDAVVVLPVLADGSIVMIGQYRYPHGRTHWEVPAGRIHPGESPAEAARRELREETGCAAGELVPLPGFYPTNGISAHYAHAFVALSCERVAEPDLDASEQLVVRTFRREEAESLLDSGRLADGFTALTLLYYLRRRASGHLDRATPASSSTEATSRAFGTGRMPMD